MSESENRKNKRKKKRKRKKFSFKLFSMFIIYEVIIALIAGIGLVFYGPFDNVKRTIVGTAMATFKHKYIATTFLSDEKINEILNSGKSTGNDSGEAVSENLDEVKVSHSNDKSIERYEIHDMKFDAYILEIKDPKRLKAGYTSRIGEVGERTSEIAERNGAVAAVNGGGFTDKSDTGKLWVGTGAYPDGIIISDGKLIYPKNSSKAKETYNVTAFTADGKLIVGNHTVDDLLKQGVVEALSFRNSLIVSGTKSKVIEEGLNPRTAIGQKADGTIIMLVIDGRQKFKLGASIEDVQNILLERGAINASSLDGGSSSTMYLNGEVINNPCDWNGERTVATSLYVKP